MTSSGNAEDVTAAVEVTQSVETSPSAAAETERSGCHLSVFSSPVSDLAFSLEVLSTDGSSSQTSSTSDGYALYCTLVAVNLCRSNKQHSHNVFEVILSMS